MSDARDLNDNVNDPPVRSKDPFAGTFTRKKDDSDGHGEAEDQAREAGSGTTGHEVEGEADSDETIFGFDKK